MTKDMTQGSPLKLLLAFAVPLMLGSLFQQFYNLADTIIVGRFVGVEALAAVGSVGGLNYLVLGFVNGIACGFSIPISWTFGAHDNHEMRRYTANTVWLSIAFATVLTIVTVAMTRLVLVWTNTPADIIDLADIYIRTIFAGIPFTLLYNVTSALMRALGDSKRPLYFLLVASVLNIGLDLACIILFNMGVFGAAFATVFSQAVAGIGSLIYIMRHYPELRWSREEGRISAPHCAKLCAMGLPMGLQCSITAIGSVVLQGAVNGLGSDIVAAQTAGGKAAQFLSVPLESIGTAMTTYTSQNMGAKDLGRVNRGVNTALGIGCVYSIASFLILRVTDKLLIGLFLDASETAIMANAQSFIFWNSVFYIPLAVLIIYRYTIQGLGYSSLAMFAGVAEMIARALVGFLFVPLWGYFAACIANALVEQHISVRMTNFSTILNDLFSETDKNKYLERLNDHNLLIIDDLGIERDTEYALEQVYNIIDTRYKSGKPLIITTNLTLEELKNPIDVAHKRIYDRVLGMCVPVMFNGSNFRNQEAANKMETARKLFGTEDKK